MAKKKDPMPKHVSPMLAKLGDEPFDRKGWFFEVKWDGYRAIAELEKGKLNLYSRNGVSFNGAYPPVEEALRKIKYDCVLDGEVIALKSGKPDFHTLQRYKDPPAGGPAPLQYAIFDLLYLNGEDLRARPLRERKARLRNVLPKKDKVLVFSDDVEEKGTRFFSEMRKQNIEGMVAKDASGAYLEGKRTDSWIKIKNVHEQEAIIVGFTQPRGSRKNLGALVLGAYESGKLVYIGHSGGGFTEKELKDLCVTLSKDKIATPTIKEKVPVNSPITWVKPTYVCEVRFTEWTPEGRMRHPIYKGLRVDKKPKEVVREIPNGEASKKILPKKSSGLPARRQSPSRQGGARLFSSGFSSTLPEHPELHLTHLDKIFWPKEGYTKGDLVEYYARMANIMLPHLKDRPENLNRHPNGYAGKSFYQKNITADVPSFVKLHDIYSESNKSNLRYLLCQNEETLLYLANLGCIEINPWNSRVGSLDKPDYMIIDLDPGENTFDEVVEVARALHDTLTLACEEHYPKTSGKSGMHICVPLGAKYSYDEIKTFAELLCTIVNRRLPELTSLERSPAKRKKKIYLDYLQNRKAQTIAAPYSVRPYPGATVSTPLEWKEVKKGLDPSKFTMKTIFKRLEQKGDLWAPVLESAIDLRESITCLQKEFRLP